MGIAITDSEKAALRKDTSILEAASSTHLDAWLESLQAQIDNGVQSGNVQRSDIIENSLARYPVSLMSDCRNADGTVLDATGGDTKFSIAAGGWGTGTLTLAGEESQNETELTTLALEFALPVEYVADADVKLVVHAKYAAAGGTSPTCTIDAEVYELTDAGAVGSDLCTTSAISLTTSFADCTFTITDTGLSAGDRLMVLIRTSIAEGGDTGTLEAVIGSIELQLDVQG